MFPWEDLPEIEFEHQIRGRGVLRGDDRELRVPAFTIQRPKYGTTTGWEVLTHPDADHQEIRRVVEGLETPIRLEGESERGRDVRVPKLHVDFYTHHRLEGKCFEIEVGPDSLPKDPDQQFVLASFSFTPLAEPEVWMPVRTGKGEIKKMSASKSRDPFIVETQFGQAKFSRRFDWEDASVAGEKVPVRIPRPKLYVEIERDDRTAQPLQLPREFEDELLSFSRLLSFLSRRDVAWVHTCVGSRWEEDAPAPPQESELWRAGGGLDRSAPLASLLLPGRMEDPRNLGKLFNSFRVLDYNDAIYYAIGFLIGGITERYVEGQMMNVFTALEATVSGFCHAHNLEFIVEADFHNDLGNYIKNKIAEFVEGDDRIPPDCRDSVQDALERKMAESHTRRRSFADRAVDLVERSGAQWKDLWPEGTELRSAISKAYARRSTLIHGGKRTTDIPFQANIYRIHALTERAIYNLINGDSHWVNPRAYEHCTRLNSYDP